MKNIRVNRIYKQFLLSFSIATLFVVLISFIVAAQNNAPIQNPTNLPFYETNDFWGKVTLSLLGTASGALFGYFSSENKRRKESIELSYTIDKLSILEFKKDINKPITIRYGNNQEVKDLYLLSCDIENTGKKVIKNEYIIFEIYPVALGMLDKFLEPPLANNQMGIEEVEENVQTSKAKIKYKIRNILPGDKVGFRFISAVDNQQSDTPNLFVCNEESSKVLLIPRANSKVFEKSFYVAKFITLFLLFILIPPVFNIIPFFGLNNVISGLSALIILILIFPQIDLFSRTIADLIINLSLKPETNQLTNQSGQYNVYIGTGKDIQVGDRVIKPAVGNNDEDEGSTPIST
jgi:hypothetical protein